MVRSYHGLVATSRPTQWILRSRSRLRRGTQVALGVGIAIALVVGGIVAVRAERRGHYRSTYSSAQVVAVSESQVCYRRIGMPDRCVRRGDIEGSEPPSAGRADCLMVETSMGDQEEVRGVSWLDPGVPC